MIEINSVHKRYGKNQVLKGIDVVFNKPGITAVLGPNGSGKTTLLKCILGMVFPDKGDIYFNKANIKKKHNYRNDIIHLPQIAQFPENLTPADLVSMLNDLRAGAVRSNELIDLFGLQKEMSKKLSNLSGGTRQKVNLLLALMYDGPVLILDEPTTGLDPLAIIRLKEFLNIEKAKGKYILFTTHIMDLVEALADEIIFLLEGKVYFQGSLVSLLQKQNETNLERAIARIIQNEIA